MPSRRIVLAAALAVASSFAGGCAARRASVADIAQAPIARITLERNADGHWICSGDVIGRSTGRTLRLLPKVMTLDGRDASAWVGARNVETAELTFGEDIVMCRARVVVGSYTLLPVTTAVRAKS